VLVSEAMLQQTQVATVIEYFQRFVTRWPTIEALAQADEQQVLRAWQGLGYYRRAKNLLAAAKAILQEHHGHVPSRVELLRQLPGVGRYTAGAIASIAFGKREPILDGNVARILARWHAIHEPIDSAATRERLWSLAGQMVWRSQARAGDVNQAMMELGATVCFPKNPRCEACPVAAWCGAHHLALTDRIPLTVRRPTPRTVEHHIVAVRRGEERLFCQRPQAGLWSRMWQLPTLETEPSPPSPNGAHRSSDPRTPGSGPRNPREKDQGDLKMVKASLRRWASTSLGLQIGKARLVGGFVHKTTHRSIHFSVWDVLVRDGDRAGVAGVWRRLDDVEDLPLPNPQRRAVAMLKQGCT
jgi:A/G-specific adenine glycosylase